MCFPRQRYDNDRLKIDEELSVACLHLEVRRLRRDREFDVTADELEAARQTMATFLTAVLHLKENREVPRSAYFAPVLKPLLKALNDGLALPLGPLLVARRHVEQIDQWTAGDTRTINDLLRTVRGW